MEPRKTIAILGAGWLGMPLVHALAHRGHAVRASCRREAIRGQLIDSGADPYPIDLPALSGPLEAFLRDCSALVVTLPPGGRRLGEEAITTYLAALAPLADFLTDELHLVYTSSTGVYGRAAEGRVTEATTPAPDTHSARAVLAAERWLSDRAARLTVLRLAGLFGPGRDPASFFACGRTVAQGDAPVNMIHQADAVAAIVHVITTGATGTFNVCAATHPTKRTFYGILSQRAGRDAPIFTAGGAAGKIVDSTALRTLGWIPRYDDLSLS
ncbi:NAD-dependent epimerase/dehydratase family protein [Neolewinella sp.]|uniref:NAD-dependent epimerase/dehydratase family protein n=1 Tax=Neolewinella sp. TaxID=2993543 RepID=UPI003B518C9B